MIKTKQERIVFWVVISLILAGLTWGIATFVPEGVDWSTAFRPAVWRFLRGEDIYGVTVEGRYFFNAPWVFIPLIPLALLPEAIGRGALMVVSILAFMYTGYKLGAKPLAVVLLILSPPVIHGLLNANIDWLVAIGFVMPPQIGIFFISTKPQMGLAVGAYWLYDIWRHQGIREVMRVFAPFTIGMLLSFAIWGFWPMYFTTSLDLRWNSSLWPQSLPVGLGLLVAALRQRKINYAMAASPCFAPYIAFHSWVGVLLAIIHSMPEMIAVFVGLWILVILQI